MLAQGLAIAVAIGSTLLFLTAFLFPKLHRQDDFFWSAVGLFYALILWVCAGQIAGAVLLGQLASVILLGWFAWETLRLRQAIIDPSNIPNLDKVSLVGYVKEQLKKPAVPKPKKTKQAKPKADGKTPETGADSAATPEVATPETPLETSIAPEVTVPEAVAEDITVAEVAAAIPTIEPDLTEAPDVEVSDLTESVAQPEEQTEQTESEPETEAIAPTAAPEPTPTKKGFSFGRLFNRQETATSRIENPQSLDDIFADEDQGEPDVDVVSVVETAEEPELEATATEDPAEEAIAPEPTPEEDEKPQATE